MTVDVIIPTYKPDQRFFELIALLDKQTFPISHILTMRQPGRTRVRIPMQTSL